MCNLGILEHLGCNLESPSAAFTSLQRKKKEKGKMGAPGSFPPSFLFNLMGHGSCVPRPNRKMKHNCFSLILTSRPRAFCLTADGAQALRPLPGELLFFSSSLQVGSTCRSFSSSSSLLLFPALKPN